MSLLPLLASLLPWAASPADVLVRIFAAISLLSVEMQIATLSGAGTLRSVAVLNLVVSVAAAVWQARARVPDFAGVCAVFRVAPLWGVLALIALVAALNLRRPAEAADFYNMERIVYITSEGTIAHVPGGEPKMNILGFVHELVLADFAVMPLVGDILLRCHGVFGLFLYLTGVATARQWLSTAMPSWPWLALLAVPAVFNQLVLIKNDLFLAVPAFVALAWLMTRARDALPLETARAAWLIGFVVGCKPTNLPLAGILAVAVLAQQRQHALRAVAALAAGGLAGGLASGMFFTFSENARVYGDPLAMAQAADIGSIGGSPAVVALTTLRFGISLFDLGLLTRTWWPGRGGWGGTFGLPFVWAAVVLLISARRSAGARWVLVIVALHFAAFAITFADADVAHRLALAPALLAIAYAVVLAGERPETSKVRLALIPVLVLSAAQVVRSALLYFAR